MDFVAERLGHANFTDLQEIDLPHCDLRTIDVGNGEMFKNLRRLVNEVSYNYTGDYRKSRVAIGQKISS